MPTNWTDPIITSSTHIRTIHINELRSVVDKNRIVAGLGNYAWTDSPVSRFTHIRAVHFTEIRSAIQDLWNHQGMGGLPNWSVGSAPSSSRQVSLRDTVDLRTWIQQYQDQFGPSYDPNYWGVDSADATNIMIGSQTLFDYITQQAGAAPAFWGRYIGGSYALTSTEVAFLHSKGCKILLIYNGATASSVSGTYQDGVNDADTALSAANSLNAPSDIVIVADIEAEWIPTAAWIEGWSDTIFGSKYMGSGGIYCDTYSTNPFNSAYCTAFTSDDKLQISVGFIWTTQPQVGCTSAANAPAFTPTPPPCNNGSTVAWQYALACYNGYVDEDVMNATGYYYLW